MGRRGYARWYYNNYWPERKREEERQQQQQKQQPAQSSVQETGENQAPAAAELTDWWKKDGKVIEITDAKDWENKSKSYKKPECNTLVVLEFQAPWSGPSRFISDFIKKLAAANKDVLFLRVNYDSMEQVAANEGVDVVPTFVLYKGGNVKDKIVGAKRFDLSARIDELK